MAATVYDVIEGLEQDANEALEAGDNGQAAVFELRALRTVLTVISAQLAGLGEVWGSRQDDPH